MKVSPQQDLTFEVVIERIVPRGYGLAHAEGFTVFVALAAPGDRLRVRVVEIKGKIAFAEIEEILDAGPERVPGPCPYFTVCGGCDFQQMTYAEQLSSKIAIIRDCLRRIGRIEDDIPIGIVGSPKEFGYRSRAQWHVNPNTREIGYYKRNSRDLVAIDHCPKLVPELNAALARLRDEMPWEQVWSEKAFFDVAVGDEGQVSMNSPGLCDPKEISYSVAGETFRYSAGVFFQGNQFLIPQLLETALSGAEGRNALDLYCGAGLFALPMARRFEKVLGVEEHPGAVEFAKNNAKANGMSNVDFRTESVRHFLSGFDPGNIDFILLDPPRAGTEKETIHNLIRIGAPHISYVACEPSVLARDLKRFVEAGYRIDSITAIDLFPQTHHVETVAHLKSPDTVN
jgi:23S rRNA (uracil1939-C5)-methyltransferase